MMLSGCTHLGQPKAVEVQVAHAEALIMVVVHPCQAPEGPWLRAPAIGLPHFSCCFLVLIVHYIITSPKWW